MIDRRVTGVVLALGVLAGPAAGQTDYYNTDEGRPVRIEDAAPVERYAFEIQLAPLRVERERGAYNWELAPELAYGIFPRTQVEVGFPIAFVDGGGEGLAGIEVSALHNFNTETRTLPALALMGSVHLPVGGLGPDDTYASVKGIATRTFRWARFHANAQYTLGPEAEEAGEASRWMAGLAVDRAFPLRSLLVTADLFAEQPLSDDEDPEWTAETGLRYQTSPQFNVDVGVGRRLSGDQGWFFTVGAAHAFALRSLLPGR
ncbi:MAG TPA: hypothetical protein VF613_13930 [Longimicrobium sp.]|jgi:hypothetical protein